MPDDPTFLDSWQESNRPARPQTAPPRAAAAQPEPAAQPADAAPPTEGPQRPAEDSIPSSQWETLENMEHLLAEIRGALDAAARDAEHRAFSIAATVGAILQVVVGGLVVLALADWALGTSVPSILVKLAFAMVLQLAALTAFVVARR